MLLCVEALRPGRGAVSVFAALSGGVSHTHSGRTGSATGAVCVGLSEANILVKYMKPGFSAGPHRAQRCELCIECDTTVDARQDTHYSQYCLLTIYNSYCSVHSTV